MSYDETSAVRRLNVEELPARSPKPKEAPHSLTPTAPAAPAPSSTLDLALTAAKLFGFALSARALLLIALVGAFVLAVMAMLAQTPAALEVLIAYAMFSVIPVAVLEVRRRAADKQA